MLFFKNVLLLFAGFALSAASPLQTRDAKTLDNANPIVTLDYVTLQGATSTSYNLTYFRRIPFGASTAGPNRFRAPQPPAPITNGTYDTDRDFDMCPQRTVNGSEDCLYLGVYSRPWQAGQKLRPVLLTFYGGGFIQGSASFSIPPSGFPVLNASASNDYVVVYSNYRTNVFGFLGGRKIAHSNDTDLNTGLLDQQAALKWIQKYIHHFGGAKDDVTIWGQSAGGGSVVAQTIATGNSGKNLFKRAMSSSPFWPKTYRYDSPETEALYTQALTAVGCTNHSDEIACLKTADIQALRNISLRLSTSQQYTTSSFTWGPVLDTSFLTIPLSTAVRTRALNTPTILTSYNLHEGETFVPSSLPSFRAWLSGFVPGLDAAATARLSALYPALGTAEELSYNSTAVRAGLVYRDLVLACPAYWLSSAAHRGWVVEYTVAPAKHASDTIYVSGVYICSVHAHPLTRRAVESSQSRAN